MNPSDFATFLSLLNSGQQPQAAPSMNQHPINPSPSTSWRQSFPVALRQKAIGSMIQAVSQKLKEARGTVDPEKIQKLMTDVESKIYEQAISKEQYVEMLKGRMAAVISKLSTLSQPTTSAPAQNFIPAPQPSMPLSKSQLDGMLALGRISPQDYAKLLNQMNNSPIMPANNGITGIEAMALANAIRIQQQQQKAQSILAATNTQPAFATARPLGNLSASHHPMATMPKTMASASNPSIPIAQQMKNSSPQLAAAPAPIKKEFTNTEVKETTIKTESTVPAKQLSLEDQNKVREKLNSLGSLSAKIEQMIQMFVKVGGETEKETIVKLVKSQRLLQYAMEGLKKNEYYMTPDQVEGFSQKLQQYFAYGQKFLMDKKATQSPSSVVTLLKEPSSVPESKDENLKRPEEPPSSVPEKTEPTKIIKKPAVLTIKKSKLSTSTVQKVDYKEKIEEQLKKDVDLAKSKEGELDYTFATTAAEVLRLRSGIKDETLQLEYKEYSSEDEMKSVIGEDFFTPFSCIPTEAPNVFTQDELMDMDELPIKDELLVMSEDNHALSLEDWLSSKGIFV